MDTFITAVIGIVIGMSSGMFGIGGALIATPLLHVLLGMPAKLALATPLPAAIPAAISGSIAYARNRLVRFDIAWRVLLTAMPMNIVGAYLTQYAGDSFLMVATGAVMVYSAWSFIRRGFKRGAAAEIAEPEQQMNATAYVAGALAGFMSGFLAIGGGIVMVPAFVKILRMPIKSALATSLLCVAALGVTGVAVHAKLGHVDWHVALILSVAVIPASYVGARLATSLKNSTLERVYGVVMLAFALYFVINSLMQ